jgi:uncharacterized protein YcbK (DUF882 family)
MVLTPNFNKKEFASRDGAGMPESVWANIKVLAAQLEALRNHLKKPINITSGYRSINYNQVCKGVKGSQHTLGKASDIQIKGMKPKKVYEAIEKLIEKGLMVEGGLGLYDTFVHYDIRGTQARWDKTTKNEQEAI